MDTCAIIAYHEAGHAVTRAVHGAPLGSAEITDDDGLTHFEKPSKARREGL